MKQSRLVGLCWLAFFAALSEASTILLPIPARLQWKNNLGYCGENSIQQVALYYGTYISQYRAREIIDPTQKKDVWVPVNSAPIFHALRLTHTKWDSTRPQPQYKDFLVWVKLHLLQRHPVIACVFDRGGDERYDHIVTIVGYNSDDATAYYDSDRLIFSDNYVIDYNDRAFSSLSDTYAMKGNGLFYQYCIPRDVNAGSAVTGIKDRTGTAKWVSMKLDRRDEPNITMGLAPALITATIKAHGLTIGRKYALLRYDNYSAVPAGDFLNSAFSGKTVFTAMRYHQVFIDQFMSDGIVIYRCVPLD